LRNVVLAGSSNSGSVAVIDVTIPDSPSLVHLDVGLGGGCTVDFDFNVAIVGASEGSGVRAIEVAVPSSPILGPVCDTGLSGIGAVAIGVDVAAAVEQDGLKVVQVALGDGTIIATATAQVGGGTSAAWVTEALLAVSGNDPHIAVIDFGANPPSVTYFAAGVNNTPILAADTGFIAVGDTGGPVAKLFDQSGKLVSTVENGSPDGTYSVGLSGRLGVYGTTNDTSAYLVDFNASKSTAFNADVGGGATVNCNGNLAVCGAVNAETITVFGLSSSPPALTGSVASGVPSVGSIAIGTVGKIIKK
jgi:hypothetical protein